MVWWNLKEAGAARSAAGAGAVNRQLPRPHTAIFLLLVAAGSTLPPPR